MRIFGLFVFVGVIILPFTVNGQNDSTSYSWEELKNVDWLELTSNEYDNALQLLEKAKLKALVKYGKNHPNYAETLSDLADIYIETGEYDREEKAESMKVEATKIMASVLGEDHPDYAKWLSRLALFYQWRMRNYPKAEQLLIESKNIIEKALGKEHADYETSLIDLANFYSDQYSYSKVEELYIELKDIKARAFGKDHPQYAQSLSKLAEFYYHTYSDTSRAESLYIEAKDIMAKALGQDHPEYATSLTDLASFYKRTGNHPKAEALYIESKDSWARAVGKEHPDYVTALNILGDFYKAIGNHSNAELIYIEAKDILARVLDKDNTYDYEASLKNLTTFYEELGNHSKSELIYIEAKDNLGRVLGKEHPDYETSLNNLAVFYMDIGNFSKAEPLFMESKEIKAKLLGIEHPDYAAYLDRLASYFKYMGNYATAEELYIEAKDIFLKVLGKEHRYYASSLHNLGILYVAMGKYSKAEQLFIESKDIRARVLGKENMDYASSLYKLGSLYVDMGNYSTAEALYIESQDIRAKVLGKVHPDYAASLNNLARLYREMNNYSKAEPLYIESMRIIAKIRGKEHPDYANILNNLAVLYQEMNNYSKAEPLYLESKDIRARVLGTEHADYASSLNNLAVLYVAMGNYSKAEALHIEAKDIRAKVLGTEHPDYAASLNNLASLYREMNNYSKAEPLYLESKDIRAKVLGKEHPYYAASLNNLASLYDDMGNYSKAEPLYLEATSQRLEQIVRDFPSLSEKEKQDYYSANKFYFSNFEKFCMEWYPKNPAILLSELYNLKLATKGLLFTSSNKMRQRILNSNNESLIQSFNDWQAKKNFLVKVYKMPQIEKELKNIDEKELEEEANTIEKSLSRNSELYSKEADKKLSTWEDIRMKLKNDEVAVEIMLTIKKIENKNTAIYAALIISPQTLTSPDIVVLQNGDDLEGKFIKYYRNAVKQKITDEVSYNQFWKPIADKIKGAKKVYFSADGVYNQINLNTLYNPVTGTYVMDEIEVQIVTSTKELLTYTKTAKNEIKDATLFGYPNYNNYKTAVPDSSRALNFVPEIMIAMKSDSSQRFFDGENISELPGTKVEVKAIGALLKRKKIATHKYLFDEATEEEIKKLNNPQVLHIATHGFFLSESTENARAFAGMETKKIIENPLLRSGLLFAGAKNASDITKRNYSGEDGILTAYEAMNLDLNQTDLVVMSACETGLGLTRNGEGVYGLQRAFQVAGAKSVLMSLWTVSDEATQQLMTMFYENWLSGKTSREAFRMAQLSLRNIYPEPYYWGAFVQVGN